RQAAHPLVAGRGHGACDRHPVAGSRIGAGGGRRCGAWSRADPGDVVVAPGRRSFMMRVLLAEDQTMVLGALAALLGLESDIDVLGSAADGESAWRELQRLKPDVLVTDIEMPGLTGLELAQRIRRHDLPIKVVIVTTFARPGF